MSFEVKPAVVKDAAIEVAEVNDTVNRANGHANDYLVIPGDGKMIDGARDELEKIREQLHADYGIGGAARAPLTCASLQLYYAAQDYEAADKASWASFDAQIKDPGRRDGQYGSWELLDPDGEERGVEYGEYSGILDDPTSSMEDYEEWKEIESKVDYAVEFDWLTSPLQTLGLSDPIKKFHDDMDGEWSKVGMALGAIDQICDYWAQVRRDLGATCKALDAAWDGHAANNAIGFFHDYASATQTHASALDGVRTRIQAKAIGIRMALDTVLDGLEEVADLVPTGNSVGDFLKDVASTVLKVPGKLVNTILLVFDALFALCSLLVSAFSLLAGRDDIAFPKVDLPPTLPVAGL